MRTRLLVEYTKTNLELLVNNQFNPSEVTSKPLAASGLLSYRCRSPFGWIMIGAVDDDDAMVQAKRSSRQATREGLQKWNGSTYVSCVEISLADEPQRSVEVPRQ